MGSLLALDDHRHASQDGCNRHARIACFHSSESAARNGLVLGATKSNHLADTYVVVQSAPLFWGGDAGDLRKLQALLAELLRGSGSSGELPDREVAIRQLAKWQRRKLKDEWKIHGTQPKARAGIKRAVNAKVRDRIKPLKKSKRLPFARQVWMLRKFRPSAVLDALFPERRAKWKSPTRRRFDTAGEDVASLDLTNFSLLSNPAGTLAAIREIASIESMHGEAQLHFRDPHCLDVAPYILLAEFWHDMLPIFRGGKMPVPVQKVLVKVGLRDALQIAVGGVTELSDVWEFPLNRRRPRGSSTSARRQLDIQSRETVSDQFCDALNEWLGQPQVGTELNNAGRGWIKNIFGELLENAERHSDGDRRDGAWSVAGFIERIADPDLEGRFHYVCRLGFINLGDTFAESLQRALPATLENINAYVKSCRKRGCRTSDATLWTLCAIQDGVTSVPESDAADRGGYGLQEMLALVGLLGYSQKPNQSPKVTIVSGNSCIMLRAPYIEGKRMAGENGARVLWCNEGNSSLAPPDDAFVFDLELKLPGTAISIEFVLDPDFLRRHNDAPN